VQKHALYVAVSIACFSIGILLFFFNRHWLLVYWVPSYNRSEDVTAQVSKKVSPKKQVDLYFAKDGAMKKEPSSFVSCASKAENLKLIIGNWLSLLYEERILEKRVGIGTVSLGSSAHTAYLSFDQSPLQREWSIYKKKRLLDGLCKTIERSRLGIQSLIFLVNNEQMRDEHLEFSRPYTISP